MTYVSYIALMPVDKGPGSELISQAQVQEVVALGLVLVDTADGQSKPLTGSRRWTCSMA